LAPVSLAEDKHCNLFFLVLIDEDDKVLSSDDTWVLNLANSNLESLLGPADSSSSTGEEQKVHLRKTKVVFKTGKWNKVLFNFYGTALEVWKKNHPVAEVQLLQA
jgi:hypothetical protein